MFAAVYVYGGVVNHVEISNDFNFLKNDIISNVIAGDFDIDEDCIQIWDSKGTIVFNYETDILGF